MSQRMNWSSSGNYSQDNSICPRRFPPTGHGINSVPRMQPHVPEVSMFIPNHKSQDSDFSSTNFEKKTHHGGKESTSRLNLDVSLGSVRAPIEIPSYSQPLTALKKPATELSLMFHGTLDLSVTKLDSTNTNLHPQSQKDSHPVASTLKAAGSKPVGELNATLDQNKFSFKTSEVPTSSEISMEQPNSSSLHYLPQDLSNLIRWQTQQIFNLQRQVHQLREIVLENKIIGSNNDPASSTNLDDNKINNHDSPAKEKLSFIQSNLSHEVAKVPVEPSENFDFSSSTIGFGKARDGVDGSTNKCAPIEELSFCSSLNAMQCDIQSDRDVIPPDNIDDILCENKTTMENTKTTAQRFRQTLGSLQDLIQYDRDVIPPDDIHRIISNSHSKAQEAPNDCSTLARLREMGVSFVRKEDLLNISRSQPPSDNTIMFYPKAADCLNSPSIVTSTSEYSLLLNSAALKYLNDAQLATVAQTSPKVNTLNSQFDPNTISFQAN